MLQVKKYRYNAKPIRIVDGDTVYFRVFLQQDIDFGFRLYEQTPLKWKDLAFRLHGIDAPERNKDFESWLKSSEHLKMLIGDDEVVLDTFKDPDNFGRWLCIVWKDDININEQMIADGYAVAYQER